MPETRRSHERVSSVPVGHDHRSRFGFCAGDGTAWGGDGGLSSSPGVESHGDNWHENDRKVTTQMVEGLEGPATEREFARAMRDVYLRAKTEVGYNATTSCRCSPTLG